MAKKQHHEDHPDERWLLTYADMITLLFVLFIVLFAMSAVNTSKYEALKDGLSAAFSSANLTGGESVLPQVQTQDPAPITPTAPAITPDFNKSGGSESGSGGGSTGQSAAARREEEQLKRAEREIRAAAARAGIADKVRTQVNERGLSVRLLTDDVLFTSGSADLSPRANDILAPIVQALKNLPNPVRVEGHTDSAPISTVQFPSNWELASGRAAAVVRDFAQLGVPPGRLQATGYADTRPVGSNATAAGRAQNRRVEVLVLRLLGNGPATPLARIGG